MLFDPSSLVVAFVLAGSTPQVIQPEVLDSRVMNLTQTVTLNDIPAGAQSVRMWVPIPSDTAWQRVVDCKVVSAPGTWSLVPHAQGRGDFVVVDLKNPSAGTASVVVNCVVERQGVHFPLENVSSSGELQPALFKDALDQHAPLMEVDPVIQGLADKACGSERDPAKQALLITQAVAEMADHYSKDPSKPTCGRGAASDCLSHGGGCCTDLHSLFIAMARARGIPARMVYGYRLLEGKVGKPFDPGYRCWVEFFVPGAGWVPTDVVAADNADAANPHRWASLSAARVWLWDGRSFELTPPAKAGRIDTMICGWAEIDGKPVDPLPAADGTPSKLRRTVDFQILSRERPNETVKLPE